MTLRHVLLFLRVLTHLMRSAPPPKNMAISHERDLLTKELETEMQKISYRYQI